MIDPLTVLLMVCVLCVASYQVGKAFERDRWERAQARQLAKAEKEAAERRMNYGQS
jgi:hypothetical protein